MIRLSSLMATAFALSFSATALANNMDAGVPASYHIDNTVHHIDARNIKKVTHFQDHVSVFMTNGCVMVGQAVSHGATPPRYRYKGQLCKGKPITAAPEAPFVIPPDFRGE